MRKNFLPFHLPSLGAEEHRAVEEVLRSGWLTTGPRAKQFEENFAGFVGCKYALAVNSATAALHLALEAIGVGSGGEVIVPTMTFAASAEVAIYLNAHPVLVDCVPDTLNMDPAAVQRSITPRTQAIMPVHFAGLPCDMDAILEVARACNVRVIEDAAHAFPSSYRGRTIGTLGDITCFSFYVTKTITTGEGGMIATDNEEWANRMRIMSLHGISKDAWKRYMAEGSWYYEILYPGFKYNLTDLAAAIGIEQLRKATQFYQARARIAELYTSSFQDLPEIRAPKCSDGMVHSWHLYVVQLEPTRLRITRDQFIEKLREQNIGTSVHFIPLHLHPLYRDRYGYRPETFPNATAAYERIVSLPIYPAMSPQDVQDVVDAVRTTVKENRR